jgi:hypothetical protein
LKKSRAITLTMMTAAAMASVHGQAPVKPVDPNSCDEILKNASLNPGAIPARCLARAHNGYAGARVGGFGAIAHGHPHGGGS